MNERENESLALILRHKSNLRRTIRQGFKIVTSHLRGIWFGIRGKNHDDKGLVSLDQWRARKEKYNIDSGYVRHWRAEGWRRVKL